jgi:hypothetical protein
MSSNTIALASVLSSGVVGAMGIGFVWWSAKQDRHQRDRQRAYEARAARTRTFAKFLDADASAQIALQLSHVVTATAWGRGLAIATERMAWAKNTLDLSASAPVRCRADELLSIRIRISEQGQRQVAGITYRWRPAWWPMPSVFEAAAAENTDAVGEARNRLIDAMRDELDSLASP